MGVFDDLSGLFNKGVASAGRVADATSAKIKMGSLDSRRRMACAQLGESLYELVLATPELQVGREVILSEIAACDQEREALQKELDRVEREAARARSAAVVYACPACGAAMNVQSRYCPHCGAVQPVPVQDEPKTPPAPTGEPQQPAAQPQTAYTQVEQAPAPQQPGVPQPAQAYETPAEN